MTPDGGVRFGLPPFHVARPRLVAELLGSSLAVVEAAAGYGKSVQRAIDAEPYDEERYVRLAGLFTSQGRVGSARAVLRRARPMLDDLGLPASSGLRAAERAAGESGPGPGP